MLPLAGALTTKTADAEPVQKSDWTPKKLQFQVHTQVLVLYQPASGQDIWYLSLGLVAGMLTEEKNRVIYRCRSEVHWNI